MKYSTDSLFNSTKVVNILQHLSNFWKNVAVNLLDYYFFEEQELSDWLSKFWFGARMVPKDSQDEGKFYSVSTL